ncbi:MULTISPECIES: site-specific DNA-methyltransferase [Microbacterium]|uniref:site-specific DNA-methyltransferase n=1 Tax=Microbacterium TaxID=33882 RepID=UPI001EF49D78|nr:DNA methyltransferase [Microbacterium sp. ACRRU]MCG7418255.1 site-specific DNA-methyltransferase [Microbacterium sp. ACRRU]
MSRLSDLIHTVKQFDPQLGADLEREVSPLQERLPFGLNFEKHQPEAVELPGVSIRVGSKVRILPERGKDAPTDRRLWVVQDIQRDPTGSRQAILALARSQEPETVQVAVDELVLVAEFRDSIYPGLRSTGSVENGGNKPFHTVINGENFHVLEALTYTHRGGVDAIYIDPPYNTGARDWKYNNDYVEGDDLYRHSKWLAFMERRLKFAKELLNPDQSVLIVSIDEKEYLRLGLLLEQVFPGERIQMVSTVINPKGVSRVDAFRRSDEYLFFVMRGSAAPARIDFASELTIDVEDETPVPGGDPDWTSMMRRGSSSSRADRPGLFYPIYVDPKTLRITEIGSALPPGEHEAPHRGDLVPVLPLRRNGSEGRWQIGPEELAARLEQGRVRTGRPTAYGYVINYLPDGAWADVQSEKFEITGTAPDGSILATRVTTVSRAQVPFTQWRNPSHNASEYGSTLLAAFLPDRKFPFPKSLYAVEDALRLFVGDNPEAIVIDFFAGSGTTAHAVMRLNRRDNGRRQSILVTNNEVAADEERALRRQGYRPGDAEWEALGICDYITKPRIRAAITGRTPANDPIGGSYRFGEQFPIADGFAENAEFFTLTYESVWRVSQHRAFGALAPLLWLRAGATGRRISALPNGWDVAESYGVLRDLDMTSDFLDAMSAMPSARLAYIITDDDRRYQMVCDALGDVIPIRLYSSYLQDFKINNGISS